jgi:endonuclease/exonuclease/phosphatase family metal-dependent hydrolase
LNKIISIKKTSSIFLAIVLVAGTIASLYSLFMTIGTAQAQPYYGMDNYKSEYGYDYDDANYNNYPKKSSDVNIQKIECINANINVNELGINQIPQETNSLATTAEAAANEESNSNDANTQSDKGFEDRINFDSNHLNICLNNNKNHHQQIEQIKKASPLLTLMTWNVYLGADLSLIFNATTPEEFFAAVGAAYDTIQATNFVERANSIADEIQKTSPDLIGLQEVALLRTQSPPDGPATPATNVSFDYLQILIDALNARGLKYEPIVVQTAFDAEAPGLISGSPVDIRLNDREVILAKADRDFTLSNIQGAQFAANFTVPTPFGSISLPRAWVSVDVTFDKGGDKARIVSTHLEPLLHPQLSPIIQELQADELLNGPGNTNLPVVFIGDFNSNPDGTGTATYSKLINAGFIDAWTIAGKGNGFTCCQDEDLLNQISFLDRRIDLILFRGNFDVKDIELVGNSQNDRTTSGLWPSDHAGVVAKLKLNK